MVQLIVLYYQNINLQQKKTEQITTTVGNLLNATDSVFRYLNSIVKSSLNLITIDEPIPGKRFNDVDFHIIDFEENQYDDENFEVHFQVINNAMNICHLYVEFNVTKLPSILFHERECFVFTISDIHFKDEYGKINLEINDDFDDYRNHSILFYFPELQEIYSLYEMKYKTTWLTPADDINIELSK